MEDWQREFEWLRVRHFIKDSLQTETLPDLNAVLFLIGVQELGFVRDSFTKEEKQDLMHLAVCHLLSEDGYFEWVGLDADGWPHYKQVLKVEARGADHQEILLIEKVIAYFRPAFEESDAQHQNS
ncbi:MAG: hypothetical protein ACO4CH_00375 [Saprospiraceae bacterium]|jgi:hypothetical protein